LRRGRLLFEWFDIVAVFLLPLQPLEKLETLAKWQIKDAATCTVRFGEVFIERCYGREIVLHRDIFVEPCKVDASKVYLLVEGGKTSRCVKRKGSVALRSGEVDMRSF